jgi:hypothetical protein
LRVGREEVVPGYYGLERHVGGSMGRMNGILEMGVGKVTAGRYLLRFLSWVYSLGNEADVA